MGKFKTQWDSCAPLLHEIGDEDTAIPDLTYSITEMRRKFILEQELMKASAKQPEYPRDNDLVDIATMEDRVSAARKRLPALRAAKLAAEKAKVSQTPVTGDPGSIASPQSPTPPAQS